MFETFLRFSKILVFPTLWFSPFSHALKQLFDALENCFNALRKRTYALLCPWLRAKQLILENFAWLTMKYVRAKLYFLRATWFLGCAKTEIQRAKMFVIRAKTDFSEICCEVFLRIDALHCDFDALTCLANALKKRFNALKCLLEALKQISLNFVVKFSWNWRAILWFWRANWFIWCAKTEFQRAKRFVRRAKTDLSEICCEIFL